MRYTDCNNLPGYGDEITWPPYAGHPNDPRRDKDEDDDEDETSNLDEEDEEDFDKEPNDETHEETL
ncbi:hypothetical protein CCP4SC76_5850012 [Gammaproteobacteria bacterium]